MPGSGYHPRRHPRLHLRNHRVHHPAPRPQGRPPAPPPTWPPPPHHWQDRRFRDHSGRPPAVSPDSDHENGDHGELGA